MNNYYADLGATVTRSHKASAATPKTTTVKLHPVAKANIAAVQGRAAAEAALASTQSRVKLFVVLGLVAAGGGVWWFMKKRKKAP